MVFASDNDSGMSFGAGKSETLGRVAQTIFDLQLLGDAWKWICKEEEKGKTMNRTKDEDAIRNRDDAYLQKDHLTNKPRRSSKKSSQEVGFKMQKSDKKAKRLRRLLLIQK
jgi:hypothetical protein